MRLDSGVATDAIVPVAAQIGGRQPGFVSGALVRFVRLENGKPVCVALGSRVA